ncbi:MAG: S8 family serine peptidase [Clostridiales bacterium]|nr:S8 family serine peptidase [Clostridiales bacterium]
MKKDQKLIKYLALGLTFTFLFLPSNSSHKVQETNLNNELLILWQDGITKEEKNEYLSTYRGNYTITSEYDNFMLLSTTDAAKAESIYNDLSLQPSICTVDYNSEITVSSTDDPYTSAQWGLDNPGYYDQLIDDKLINVYSTKDIDMNMSEAWAVYNKEAINTREVIVAIIDTGVDTMQPDLKHAIWTNPGEIPGDGIDNDGNGYVDDINGWDFYNDDNSVCHYQYNIKTGEIQASEDDSDEHGTHCAGIIAAAANNRIGIAGVASNINVKIMPLKIHGGPSQKGTIADAILAIKYATIKGADIVNMSWGSTIYNKALKKAIQEAPMLFIAAAGNKGENNDEVPVYPASYNLPNLISVTFINQYGYLTNKSNYGKRTVDIAAPGMDILSTAVGNSYSTLSGSSMAVPHITGLAAILYSWNEHITPASVKNVILSNIKKLSGLEGYVKNPGIPDAKKMIQNISDIKIDVTPPTIHINTFFEKDKIMVGVYARDEKGSGVRVVRYLPGKKDKKAFKKGTIDSPMASNTATLNKGGTYTFYASDYAGNEKVLVYDVIDDKDPPLVSSSFHYSLDGRSVSVDLKVIDELSGVKTLRYAKGKYSTKDFASGYLGQSLTLKNNACTLRLFQPGEYTFYTVDYRGNKTTHVVNIMQKPITRISVPFSSTTLKVGTLQKLKISYLPKVTTDKIFYSSSNPSVVSISQWGALHAKSKGRAVITISSTSGISKSIVVNVQ